jgi:hypothetical protein
MSCITQHKTKEELSNWLMENASDNETTGFLDMLAGDIWDMMTAETELKEKTAKHLGMAETLHDAVVEENKKLKEENKKQKKEHIQNIMKINRIATELYREVKYALGYGEFDEPDRKVMYDEIKKLKEEKEVVQDINGKNLKIPTEEELKVLGVSREEFIMLAKQCDCAY